MADVTFTISTENLPLFIEAFKEDYDQRVSEGELQGVTESQYAKQNAFTFLAGRVRKFHKQKAANELTEVDITLQ